MFRPEALHGMRTVPLSILTLLLFAPGCGDDGGTAPGDRTPPAAAHLEVLSTENCIVLLVWTAPGDDGMEGRAARYDLRCAAAPFTEATWDSATVLDPPGDPRPAGVRDSATVVGLLPGIWCFGLKSADKAGNWSELSNVPCAMIPDTIPPHPVADLASAGRTLGSVTLSWTAPADDCVHGGAAMYDLRLATAPITEQTWGDAAQAVGEPAPGPAGSAETFTVVDLEPGVEYHFALRAADWMNNWSELSNVATETTLARTRLTFSSRRTGATNPAWSPDGSTIAFVADWEQIGRSHIHLIPASGGDPVRLTDRFDSETDPIWSPDGEQLAFVAAPPGGEPNEIWIMEADPGAEPALLVHHDDRTLSGCSWSPDGARIAYAACAGSASGCESDIYIVGVDGGPPFLWAAGSADDADPSWSPDGAWIAFASDRSGSRDIWVKPVDGGDAVRLTDDPARDARPAWSPDGTRIAFASDRRGGENVWIVSSDGGRPTQWTFLTTGGGAEPGWSPDGERLCFVSVDGEVSDVWVFPLE